MQGRKKILYRAQKEEWMRECLSLLAYYLNHFNNNVVMADILSKRESISINDHHPEIPANQLDEILRKIDAREGGYKLRDEGRIGAWLLDVGFDEQYLSTLSIVTKLKYEAVVFAVLGDVSKTMAVFYTQLLQSEPDPDNFNKIKEDWEQFSKVLEKAVILDCKKKVVQLMRDCRSYRDYLANDIVSVLRSQSHELKDMHLPYYKDADKKVLDIAAIRQNVEMAIHFIPDRKNNADDEKLLKLITKYEAVNELMQKLSARGKPFLVRLTEFEDTFRKLKPVLDQHRDDKIIPARFRFWSSEGRKATEKMEDLISGVKPPKK